MRRFGILVVLVALSACNGNGTPLPAQVAALQNFLRTQMFTGLPALVTQFIDLLPLFVDPDAATAAGVTITPDTDPLAPPNSYIFSAPLDTDGDGTDDTVVTGDIVLSGDPLTEFGPGFFADMDLTLDRNGGEAITNAQLHLLFTANGLEASGNGDFIDNPADTRGTFFIDAADPLVINSAATGSDGNLCGADGQGPIQISAGPITTAAPMLAGLPPGFWSAIWRFLFGSRNVRVTNGTYNDPVSGPQTVADSTVQIPACGAPASLAAWEGAWTLDWYCNPTGSGPGGTPFDNGMSNYNVVQSGANTLQFEDSGRFYTATVVGGNPRVVSGNFTDSDSGGTYLETFTYTLNAAGTAWTETTHYVYTSGPAVGNDGDCYGTAVR